MENPLIGFNLIVYWPILPGQPAGNGYASSHCETIGAAWQTLNINILVPFHST
jgi:hypothetical protein